MSKSIQSFQTNQMYQRMESFLNPLCTHICWKHAYGKSPRFWRADWEIIGDIKPLTFSSIPLRTIIHFVLSLGS